MRFSSQTNRLSSAKGFTLIEVLIIAPVVILAISGFVALMITMTADVLVTRDYNSMAYETQDALDRIEQDVRLSTQFLVTSGTFTAPQGSNNNFTGTAAFTSTTGTLILGGLTTDKNPADSTRQLVYYAGQPNVCGAQQSYNRVFLSKVMYFLKDGDLWRRAVLPNYNTNVTLDDDTVCSAPWQRNTCSPGYSVATRCQTNDTMLMENVDSFGVKYFTSPNSTTDVGPSQALAATTIEVTLNGKKVTSGQDITSSRSMRATKLNNIDVDLPIPNVPVVSSQPDASGPSVTFTWAAVPLASSYPISYNINGGAWVNAVANSQTTSYTVNANRGDTVTISVYSRNSSGSSAPGGAAGTIPLWNTCSLQSGWGNYGYGYSTQSYTKTIDSTVMLKGVIGGGAQGTTICVLPAGFRPTKDLIFQTATNNVASRIDITANGLIVAVTSNSAWLTLDGINFIASTSPHTWTTPTKVNGWVDFGAAYAPLQTTQDALGRTHTQGVVKSGTFSPDGTNVANNMPVAQRTTKYMTFPAASNSAFNYMGVGRVNGSLDARGVSASGYYSLQTMFYPAGSTGWTPLTLQNGWVSFDPNFSTPQYRKFSDGMVTVTGMIKSGTTATDTTIAQLPVGYRPKEILVIHGAAWGAYSRLDVLPNGRIIVVNAHNGWTSMDAISFMAEQ